MKLYPFRDCVEMADKLLKNSKNVETYQQFQCVGCGSKQTMEYPFTFYTIGHCEECDRLTDIQRDGCNFAVVATRPRPKQTSS
ncbi:MAG TPA: hypothetical protein VHT68_22110 [Pseudolabrys sp.]|nr:hypothetical protein [Pseudolabrys sp.]